MSYGLLSGLLWGLDTVLLDIVLGMSHFVQSEWIIFLAPFISTFFHDIFTYIRRPDFLSSGNFFRPSA